MYLSLAELKEGARVIAFDKDVRKPNAFYAGSGFVEKYPALVARLNGVFAAEGRWADSHHEEVAKAQTEATGVDIEAVRRFVDRSRRACRRRGGEEPAGWPIDLRASDSFQSP